MSFDIPKAHATSLEHDGVLQRWCPIQDDVEEFFRKTLPEVFASRAKHLSLCGRTVGHMSPRRLFSHGIAF
jgi:hypothetical protein